MSIAIYSFLLFILVKVGALLILFLLTSITQKLIVLFICLDTLPMSNTKEFPLTPSPSSPHTDLLLHPQPMDLLPSEPSPMDQFPSKQKHNNSNYDIDNNEILNQLFIQPKKSIPPLYKTRTSTKVNLCFKYLIESVSVYYVCRPCAILSIKFVIFKKLKIKNVKNID